MEELNKIQKELKAPKNQYNSFGKYNYRSCEDILEAVKPMLGGGNLIISDEIVMLGDRYYVKATVKHIDSAGNVNVSTAYAREPQNKKGMDESQITGTASSYARKYALNGLFCIDDTKDADTMDNRPGSVVTKNDNTCYGICSQCGKDMLFSQKKNKLYCSNWKNKKTEHDIRPYNNEKPVSSSLSIDEKLKAFRVENTETDNSDIGF